MNTIDQINTELAQLELSSFHDVFLGVTAYANSSTVVRLADTYVQDFYYSAELLEVLRSLEPEQVSLDIHSDCNFWEIIESATVYSAKVS